MIYSSPSIFCNSSWFVNDWNQTAKVKVIGDIEEFLGLKGDGKVLKALKSPSGGLPNIDRTVFFNFLVLFLLIGTLL